MKEPPHLNTVKYIMLVTGLWTLEHTDERVLRMYNFYSKFYRYFFLTNFCSIMANLPFCLDDGDALIENMSFSVTYSLIAITVSYTNSELVKDIIKKIMEKEKYLKMFSNKEVRRIYYRYSKYNSKINLYILGTTCVIMFFLYVAYIFSVIKGMKGTCLFPTYLPFHIDKYLVVAIPYSTLQLIVAGILYAYTKMLFISLITYGVSSLKILQYFLKYYKEYSKVYSQEKNISIEEAEYMVLRSCILEHKNIIGYITAVKTATAKFMLINFCMTSVELCAVLLRLITIKNKEDYLATILLLGMHLSHLTILYWNADLIRAESIKIGDYAYLYTRWSNCNSRFCYLAQIMMLRSQTPLTLAIGPFGVMSNTTLVSILKAAFSYLTFFRAMFSKD